MKIWLITDTHFGHEKVKEFCGRPEGFEQKILDNLKRVVNSDDILINLGDFCWGNDDYWAELFNYPHIKAKSNILVRGNHDKKSLGFYAEFFDMVCDSFSLNMFGKRILFSHIPQEKSPLYDLNIHGHFHNTDHRKNEKYMQFIYDPTYHKKLAVEDTNYEPVLLEKFIRN